jgi:hypothetical protein
MASANIGTIRGKNRKGGAEAPPFRFEQVLNDQAL